jgi:hypothetical protein
MRYVNLVPQPTVKPKPEMTNYERYLENNIRYENTPERKEYMKKYNKAYRNEHEDHVQCDCGSIVKGISMYTHVKSKKHLAYLTK